MTASFLINGLIIGFSIAAPVGPIGVLCIRRSLADGMLTGFAAGLGAATADAVFGCIAGFGLTAVSGFLIRQQFWLALFGGAFLCYLGIRTFLSRPAQEAATARGTGLASTYGTTFLLTLSNPATILSFVAVFAGFGLGQATNYLAAVALVAGVFLGSAAWWLMLSGGVALFRNRLGAAWMKAVNRLSGCVLLGFGLYALTRAFWK